MTTVQIIGLIVVALLGLCVFYCIYDLQKFNKKKDRCHKSKALTVLLTIAALFAGQNAWAQIQIQDVTLTVDPEIPEGTAGHWYVNMGSSYDKRKALTLTEYDITTGGKNVFKVYDDGGKKGNYTPTCQSYFYITVPVGYLIQVSGTVWTKRDPSIEYLKLNNAYGDYNPLTYVYSDADGEAKDFGPLLTHKVTSTINTECTDGQYLTVYFRATDDETTYRGFDMTVTVFENTHYNVNIAESIQHGSVIASTTTAYYNDEVTLTVTPETNYYIGTVSYNDGTTDHVITPQNNVYKFTMPQHDVTVSATFLDEVGHLWGEGNDGSEAHPYVIRNQAGWDLLVTKSEEQNFTNGKYFELATNISGVTQGIENFGGHLDGKGHKITLAMGLDGEGLIRNIRSTSSFSNITLEGSIVNSASTVGGFVASAGFYDVTFTNCRCSVAITSNYSGNSNEYRGGGFIGLASTKKVFDRCVFDGSFSNNNLSFFPWIGGNGGCTITNSAYLYGDNAGFRNGSIEARAYLLTLTEPAAVVRTGGTAIGNGAGIAYADGFNYGGIDYYINGATVIFGVSGIIATAAQYNDGSNHNATLNSDGTASFTMPTTNTTASVTSFAANYIDANGTLQTHAVSLLSSSEEAVTIAGGWYAVTGDVTLNKGLTFSSAAHLILTDGSTLVINNHYTTNNLNRPETAVAATDLSVYGQTHGTGTLNADCTNRRHTDQNQCTYAYGIQVTGDITFCGGYVNATVTGLANSHHAGEIGCYAIQAGESVTITRGHVNANATKNYTGTQYNIYQIFASAVILDWRLPTDRIRLTTGSSGNCSTVSVAEGKSLWNGTEVLSGGIGRSQFNDKTLQPCITREIEGYGTGNDKWAFIASPVTADDGILPTAVGNIFSAAEYDLYRLNPSNTMWENYKKETHTSNFRLVNGQGYLYATKETKTLAFMGDAFNMGTEKTIENLPQGFNLVGNPFIVDAYVTKPYYTLNSDGSAILTTTSTAAILPCTGVIVEVEENEDITFSTTAPTLAAPNNGSLQITLTQANTRGNALLDNAIVSFNEGSQLGKFYFGEQNGNIYIPQDGKEYAIAYSNGQGEMPLNFKAKENGEYTLTVSPLTSDLSPLTFNFLHLIDNIAGQDVDLLVTPTYTFTAGNDDYASRFKLVFSAQQGEVEADDDFAFISNGKIIINGEGTLQVIDALGRILFTKEITTANCQLPTSNYKPGVYVLRLINGNDVRTQKIVIR